MIGITPLNSFPILPMQNITCPKYGLLTINVALYSTFIFICYMVMSYATAFVEGFIQGFSGADFVLSDATYGMLMIIAIIAGSIFVYIKRKQFFLQADKA